MRVVGLFALSGPLLAAERELAAQGRTGLKGFRVWGLGVMIMVMMVVMTMIMLMTMITIMVMTMIKMMVMTMSMVMIMIMVNILSPPLLFPLLLL